MTVKLRKYQKDTIKRVTEFKGRALLALEMGLGKTICALHWAARKKKLPVVVVCPASIKWQWQDEAWEHYGLSSVVCTGRQPKGDVSINPTEFDVLIINYDILEGWVPWIDKHFKPKTIIIDECQHAKNPKAKRTKALKKLCKKKPHILALSGTPMTNRPVELYPIINAICPGMFGSFMAYTEQYCSRRRTRWGWEYRGAKNLDRLHRQLKKHCMIRYRKRDVLKELPAKERHVITLDIVRRLEYMKAERDLTSWLKKISRTRARQSKKAEQVAKMMILRQLAAELKMKYAFDWIDTFLDGSDRKLVIYVWHKKIVRMIEERYNCAVITGDTAPHERKQQVSKFCKNPKCRVFVGNIKAAGSGIDGLQKSASDVAFLELPWSPADLEQAEDRLHRIGQNNGVQVHILVARDTIEHDLMRILQTKKGILDQTLDGEEKTDLVIFDQLVAKLQKGRK